MVATLPWYILLATTAAFVLLVLLALFLVLVAWGKITEAHDRQVLERRRARQAEREADPAWRSAREELRGL